MKLNYTAPESITICVEANSVLCASYYETNCPNCHKPVKNTDEYCSHCGVHIKSCEKRLKKEREDAMRCPHCGKVRAADNRYCEHCGTKIKDAE